MSTTEFDEITSSLESGGIASALECVIQKLREQKKYHELFEALKMQVRQRIGLPLWYQDTFAERDAQREQQLERGLLDACSQVGNGLLADGRIREAWMYLRPIGDKAAVAEQLRRLRIDDEQVDELIEVTVHEGVDPPTGFACLLNRYGTCNAITTFDAQAPAMEPAARRQIAGMLVRHIYRELVENVRAHIEREAADRQETIPSSTNLSQLCAKRDWLTADGSYHIDTSHLSSVVRCARLIEDREELHLARELAEYGGKLDPSLQYPDEEPFADTYKSHTHYFNALLGHNVDEALAFFRERAKSVDAHHEGTLAAEVYVELLARTGHIDEAIDATLQMLPPGTHTRGVAPPLLELARQAGDYTKVLELCRQRDDLLGFATAVLYGASTGAETKNE